LYTPILSFNIWDFMLLTHALFAASCWLFVCFHGQYVWVKSKINWIIYLDWDFIVFVCGVELWYQSLLKLRSLFQRLKIYKAFHFIRPKIPCGSSNLWVARRRWSLSQCQSHNWQLGRAPPTPRDMAEKEMKDDN
jgi:hypothetical protein